MAVDPELVTNFVAWSRLGGATRDEEVLEGAWERAMGLAAHWPDEGWELALAVLAVGDRNVAVDVGISLLEDLMRDHAARFIDRLETATRTDEQMACAVASMWIAGEPVETRFRALVRYARWRTAVAN